MKEKQRTGAPVEAAPEHGAAAIRRAAPRGIKKGFSLVLRDEAQGEELLPMIAEGGFKGIEPTFNTGAYPSPEKYTREAPRLRARCAGLGLEVIGMRAGRKPWTLIPSPEPKERKAALSHTKRALECVRLLGGDVLLVVPGEARPDIPYDDHWKRVVEYGAAAADLARDFGVTIGLENVEARFPLSAREWKSLIEEIDRPEVRMYLDIGNVAWLGLGFPEQWVASLGDVICRLHVKDATRDGRLRNLLAGEIDWKAVTAAIRAIGYKGWISVEPEWYKHLPERLPERLARDLDAILSL